ncbi:PFAM 2Fe-2S iron-sulfur cluster binding protein [Aureococcus anophagefferens]|uniref:PFAM 2Fe-2S iron-sulfur cluster binding protein n=1 Tax=Aureococcus anophagefferens TaxID=44056 RepID=A0ABR1G6E5_AURAN
MRSFGLALLPAVVVPFGGVPPGVSPHRRTVALRESYDVTLDLPDGQSVTFPCADDEFILDAAEEAGFELPASCRSGARAASTAALRAALRARRFGSAAAPPPAGACTVCQGRVTSGTVEHDDQSTLDDEQLAAGYTCAAPGAAGSFFRVFTGSAQARASGRLQRQRAPLPLAAVADAAPASAELWTYKMKVAESTLAMLKEVVEGRPDLVAKCDEMEALLHSSDHGAGAAAAPAGQPAEYTPFYSKDTGYTIWLNKNNPRNSYYEYDKKK